MIAVQKKEKKEVQSKYEGLVVLDGPPVDFSNKKLKSLEGASAVTKNWRR